MTTEISETGKRGTEQIKNESEPESPCNSDGNVCGSKHEVPITSGASTRNTPMASKQKVFKSRIPVPVSRARDSDRKTSQMIRKSQIVDDLFISKITINDELKFLRRDLALGWLTRHEARERIHDVKQRFNVDLCSYLTNHEFQQIFGGNDDESEWQEESNKNVLSALEESVSI